MVLGKDLKVGQTISVWWGNHREPLCRWHNQRDLPDHKRIFGNPRESQGAMGKKIGVLIYRGCDRIFRYSNHFICGGSFLNFLHEILHRHWSGGTRDLLIAIFAFEVIHLRNMHRDW